LAQAARAKNSESLEGGSLQLPADYYKDLQPRLIRGKKHSDNIPFDLRVG